jgi:hypothetical protein
MKAEDPFLTFDWYFADVSEKDGARFHALEDKKKETSVLIKLIEADSIVHFSLWNELPKNHPVGELWLESQTDLLATIYLAYGGFFRQALAILRCWYEIAIHGVFFSAHYGQPTSPYEQWRNGQRNAPANMLNIAKSLATRQDIIIKLGEDTIFRKLNPLYSFLSQQTHAQGLDTFNLQEGRDNVPRYLQKSFDIWYEKVMEVFDTFCFLYRLFYVNEIAAYLGKSEAEKGRAIELKNSLSKSIPEFGILMDAVLKKCQEKK